MELRPDCERCFGLCCVAPVIRVSPDFAIEKDAGDPCPNLAGIRREIRALLLRTGDLVRGK